MHGCGSSIRAWVTNLVRVGIHSPRMVETSGGDFLLGVAPLGLWRYDGLPLHAVAFAVICKTYAPDFLESTRLPV